MTCSQRLVATALLMIFPCLLIGCGESKPEKDRTETSSDKTESKKKGPQESESGPSPFRFTEVTDSTGIDFVHQNGDSKEKPFPAANGSGIAVLDYDYDGWPDLYFATGTPFPIREDSGPVNRFFRNLGEFSFVDVSKATGLEIAGYSAGVTVGDFDNDGFPDLFVNRFGQDVLYRNRGDGTFNRVEDEAGILDDRWGTSACFLDFNEDGLLDLYVCNYGKWSLETNQFCGDPVKKIRIFCSPNSIKPEEDVLYQNLGDGGFEDVTKSLGMASPAARSQGVVTGDINQDGHVDIYVGNDLHPNSLWISDGKGGFVNHSESSGAAYDQMGRSQAGMGVDLRDMNGDLLPEIFVTNYEGEYNTLYQNTGDCIFNDVSTSQGLATAAIPWIGWGTLLEDFDLDGKPDVVVTNGHTDDNLHEMGRDASFGQPPLMWKNEGKKFRNIKSGIGSYFDTKHPGRALVASDLDRDGDLDLVVGHQNQKPAILRNDSVEAPRSKQLVIQLIGTKVNREGLGATIKQTIGDSARIYMLQSGRSYLSSCEKKIYVINESGAETVQLSVRWPGTEAWVDVSVPKSFEGIWQEGELPLVEPGN